MFCSPAPIIRVHYWSMLFMFLSTDEYDDSYEPGAGGTLNDGSTTDELIAKYASAVCAQVRAFANCGRSANCSAAHTLLGACKRV